MRIDALYAASPRWLDYSGLPEQLEREIGPGAWELFRRLTESETARNLFPDWFVVETSQLGEITGLSPETVGARLGALAAEGWIRLGSESESGSLEVRIASPLPVPRTAEEIRGRMKALGFSVKGISFRYLEDEARKSDWQRVLDMYHNVFGTRMNSRIAEDLRHLAEHFEPGLLTEAFTAAKAEEKKSLAWILARLYRGGDHELPKTESE
ncbi:hypothetical protein HS125_02045 [bacterium]|nr:hypothetical protein [bacterium]